MCSAYLGLSLELVLGTSPSAWHSLGRTLASYSVFASPGSWSGHDARKRNTYIIDAVQDTIDEVDADECG